MKESPQDRKLEGLLMSSRLAAGGFMGHDTRCIREVIEQRTRRDTGVRGDLLQRRMIGTRTNQREQRVQDTCPIT